MHSTGSHKTPTTPDSPGQSHYAAMLRCGSYSRKGQQMHANLDWRSACMPRHKRSPNCGAAPLLPPLHRVPGKWRLVVARTLASKNPNTQSVENQPHQPNKPHVEGTQTPHCAQAATHKTGVQLLLLPPAGAPWAHALHMSCMCPAP